MFKPGEPIDITGAPDRFDAYSCYVNTVVFADGTTADRYAQLVEAARSTATGRERRGPRACRAASRTSRATGRRSSS